MPVTQSNATEEDMKKFLSHIAMICLSEEFQSLKMELEAIYSQSNIENAGITAFQDALYACLAQEEDGQPYMFCVD